ncbi:hypothetical protein [Maritalea myrionectae]|uniref:hypothetical protein n=1 Tax=Maritalea myrionectae TaxID=454601 RepID=UPI0004256618|nr:hypothetical protein [Maritalea myrionectae]
MPSQITTKIMIHVDEANGKHKVIRQGVTRDETGTFPDAPFEEPAKRADIEAILGTEVGLNAERVTALTEEVDALNATVQSQALTIQEKQNEVDAKAAQIQQLQQQLANKGAAGTISATDLRLKLLEIGFDNTRIEEVFASVEADDPAEAERVRIIWEYNTWYRRSDPLVDLWAGYAGLTSEQVDTLFGLTPPAE